MRFAKFLALLSLAGLGAYSQNETTLFGVQFDRSYNEDTYNSGFGINLEGMFKKRLSVYYSFLYGPMGNDEYYLYSGGGQAASVYLFNRAISERKDIGLSIILGLFSFILPESYGYRIPVSTKSQLAFFLAPYGFEFVKNRETGEEDHNISIELGCRYYLAANKWLYFMPHIGVKKAYNDDGIGGAFGISIMFITSKN